MSEEPPESVHVPDRFTLQLKGVECRLGTSTVASSCLRPQATAACGDDQEDRLGTLNRWRSQSCCTNRVFGNDREIHPVMGLEFCPKGKTCTADSDVNWKSIEN